MSFKNFLKIAQRAGKEFAETTKDAYHDIKEDLKSQDTKLAEVLKKIDDPNVSKEEVKASIKKMVMGDKYSETKEEELRKLKEKLQPELDKFAQVGHLDADELESLNNSIGEILELEDPDYVKGLIKKVRKINVDLEEANRVIKSAASEVDSFLEEIKPGNAKQSTVDAEPEV